MSNPLARSPIPVTGEPATVAGWQVSAHRASAPLRLTDCTPLAKIGVRAPEHGRAAASLAVAYGRAARDDHGALVIGAGPGEWLLLTPPGTAAETTDRLDHLLAPATADELITIIDLTHGRALMRLTGNRSPDLLAKVCAIDLSDTVTPNGAAFRSSVARLATDVIRDDVDASPSYLLHCDTSSGAYLHDALLDAGGEFGIEIDGFADR